MPNKTTISGAEALIKCLLAEGVDLAFGYPGGAIMPVYDELYKFQDQLHHVLTRHEQGAIHRRARVCKSLRANRRCFRHIRTGSNQHYYGYRRCPNRFYTVGLHYRTSGSTFIGVGRFSRN